LLVTVLCDWEIRALCRSGMVEGYSDELINPASLDVRLGNHLMIEVPGSEDLVEIDISKCTKDRPYYFLPGEFCLAETMEIFHIPDSLSAQFVLKSSRAREGLTHALAGWADPGWGTGEGCPGSRLTLELINARKHWHQALYPGMKVGQMVFLKMSSVPLVSYSKCGRYNGDLKVKDSRG